MKQFSMKWMKYGVAAAGILISAALYAGSGDGEQLLLRKDAHTVAEMTVGMAPGQTGETNLLQSNAEMGKAAPLQNNLEKNQAEGNAKKTAQQTQETEAEDQPGLFVTLTRKELDALIRQAVREELAASAHGKSSGNAAGNEAGNTEEKAEEAWASQKNADTLPEPSGSGAAADGKTADAASSDGLNSPERSEQTGVAGAKINLNTATREELMQLKGIGASKADAIISYRETYGGFGYPEEIMNISGIKEAAFEKIKNEICV